MTSPGKFGPSLWGPKITSALFGCWYSGPWHWIGPNIKSSWLWYWHWTWILLFGCAQNCHLEFGWEAQFRNLFGWSFSTLELSICYMMKIELWCNVWNYIIFNMYIYSRTTMYIFLEWLYEEYNGNNYGSTYSIGAAHYSSTYTSAPLAQQHLYSSSTCTAAHYSSSYTSATLAQQHLYSSSTCAPALIQQHLYNNSSTFHQQHLKQQHF